MGKTLLGLSRSCLSRETENCLEELAERFGTHFVIDPITNLPHDDVTMESLNSCPCKPSDNHVLQCRLHYLMELLTIVVKAEMVAY